MKLITLISLLLAFSLLMNCKGQNKPENTISLNNRTDSISYYLALNIAQNVKSQGLTEINTAAVAKAFNDVFSGGTTLADVSQTGPYLNQCFMELQVAKSETDKKAGTDFLELNKSKSGVITLPSGLQYEVLTAGQGQQPKATDVVTVHYSGTTIDGKVFDSSIERGEPASFAVNEVIMGWQEALQLMAVGSKWKLYVPSNLAYGERGAGEVIPPNAALIFEVELLSIGQK
ncbi:MAG TPA: FKBP-type peptidyl-prolyl cis-trans isomerase [Cyclobacteriaceae bacterium]|nr:FKBP-type peptidyl-prolyl cis-trans isomerase [Cyclobacteriaceae bacterium]